MGMGMGTGLKLVGMERNGKAEGYFPHTSTSMTLNDFERP